MKQANVILTRCNDYAKIDEKILRLFELLGGIDKLISRGDKVLVKPNFIAPKPRCCATQTDPAVILAVVKILKDFGAKPFVGDSPAWSDVFGCVKVLGIADELKRLEVPVRQLDKPVKSKIGDTKKVWVSSVALEADKIINLPKFKSHQQLVASFAIKNMFGCVCGKQKPYWHFAKGGDSFEFCKFLIDIYKFMNPVLTIIDGVVAMDGSGPINGRARDLGWLITSSDPIACERVCCEIVNIKPEQLPILHAAERMGFGTSSLENISILGDDYKEKICTDFELAKPIPIRFSLLRVCKSIIKQVIGLIKKKCKG